MIDITNDIKALSKLKQKGLNVLDRIEYLSHVIFDNNMILEKNDYYGRIDSALEFRYFYWYIVPRNSRVIFSYTTDPCTVSDDYHYCTLQQTYTHISSGWVGIPSHKNNWSWVKKSTMESRVLELMQFRINTFINHILNQ